MDNFITSAVKDDTDDWLEENCERLTLEAQVRSSQFADIHEEALAKIKLGTLKKISPQKPLALTPLEILFLNYMNLKSTDSPGIAGYWTHEYNLDFQIVLEKLFSSGYLTLSDYTVDMVKCSAEKLKDTLQKHSLKVTGTKKVLLERLTNNLSENELNSHFSGGYFVTTILGKEILNSNEHILYFHQNKNQFNISVSEADEYQKVHENESMHEIAIDLLTQRSNKNLSLSHWGLYRNDLYALSIVYRDMGYSQNQLMLLLNICYIDLSGIGNNNEFNDNLSFLAPGVISSIKYILAELSCNTEDIKKIYDSAMQGFDILNGKYSKKETFEIIVNEIYG